MIVDNIKSIYKDIFKSYDNPSLEDHINKIIELDAYLPYSSTFFCITNTQNLTFEERKRMSYTWNYRIKNAHNVYVNVIQNTTPLEFDLHDKPIIGLAHYTVLDSKINLQVSATAKLLNENKEYETKYFNNFSQKLLSDGLSNRERDVVRLLILNLSSKDIAERLNISSNTVDTHRRNILKKLNISSTGELIGMIRTNNFFVF